MTELETLTEMYKNICLELSVLKHDQWNGTKLTRDVRDRLIDKNIEFLEVVPSCCEDDMVNKLNTICCYMVDMWFKPVGIEPKNDRFARAWDDVYVRNIEQAMMQGDNN